MKKYLVLILTIAFFSCSRKDKAVIQGKIENAGKETAYFYEIKKAGSVKLDSVKISSNGKFKFTTHLILPGFYQIGLKDDKTVTLLLFPGEKVNLHADYQKFFETKTIDGFDETKRLNSIDDSLRLVNAKLIKIEVLYDSLKVLAGNEIKTDSLTRIYGQIKEAHRKYSIKLILENLKSLSNIEAIYQQYFSGDYVFNGSRDIQYYKLVADTLLKYFPKVEMVNVLKSDCITMISKLENEKLKLIVKKADNHLPELNLLGKNGINISLSSLRGKIVLLTFWSVNQAESINNLSGLKNVYHKFKSKGFEIYQVSIDKSIADWKQEIVAEGITWPSVCDTTFPNSKTRIIYNINTIPMNYLINRDQTDILAKNIAPEDLSLKLEEVLK
jgi:peroxiredoxin